ncbi:MAG TPA: RNA polymerase sigma factor [Allosphingosinicella sp.]|jgi:RNA polymerase sigma-70 factor (ECF subfamily)
MAARLHARGEDLALAARIAQRDPTAVREVMVANNRTMFRTAWSILGNQAEAEDAVQTAYLHAFAAIDTFSGRASLATWLTRIVINEALGRRRAEQRRATRLRAAEVAILDDYRQPAPGGAAPLAAPDAAVAREQIRAIIEHAVAALPAPLRSVFVLREIEELDVSEVAALLLIPEATVRTRHLRARRQLQKALAPEVRAALTGVFPFAGAACRRLVERVVRLMGLDDPEKVSDGR